MSAFNYRHFIRTIPAPTLRKYLEHRELTSPELDWNSPASALVSAVIGLVDALAPQQRAKVCLELRQAHELATIEGIDALRNAADSDDGLRDDFACLRNHAERALWALIVRPRAFEAARTLLQFDLGVVGQRPWERMTIGINTPAGHADADLRAFESAVTALFSARDGVRRASHIDLYARNVEGDVQVSIQVEDAPNDALEFTDEGLQLRRGRPMLGIDLVYSPAARAVDFRGPGNARLRLALVALFARHLLKREVKPDAVTRPVLALNRLRDGLTLFDDNAVCETNMIDAIRLRKMRVRSIGAPACDFWVVPPSDKSALDALACAQAHFSEGEFFHASFNIVEAVLSVYFTPSAQHREGRVLNIELKPTGITNLHEMADADVRLAETLLRVWEVLPATVPTVSGWEGEDEGA